MTRKYILALAILGAFSIIGAGAAQAGWGHSYESTQPGESMSSETNAPEETWSSSEHPSEGMKSSEYEHEEALETGRLPEDERFGTNVIFGDDVERKLREGIVTGGP